MLCIFPKTIRFFGQVESPVILSMPFPSSPGVLYGLLSALVWGSADFTGGFASRRNAPFQVVVLGSGAAVIFLGGLVWLQRETWPGPEAVTWALIAGLFGALGIAALYRGLAIGKASLVAPTAAVVGAALPVIAGMWFEGLPGWTQSLGLLAGVLGIWQVSSAPAGSDEPARTRRIAWSDVWRQPGLIPAGLAGIAFGAFFICLARSGDLSAGMPAPPIFIPLLLSKGASLLTAGLILLIQRQPIPSPQRNPYALLSGLLDVGGNLFFFLAQQATRLDLAVIVSSMYPVATVILAALVLKQKATRQQGFGLALCLASLALIVA